MQKRNTEEVDSLRSELSNQQVISMEQVSSLQQQLICFQEKTGRQEQQLSDLAQEIESLQVLT